MGLLWKGLRLQWYGIQGMTWESFISTFDKYVKSYPRLDYLIIQAGSNDLGIVKGKVLIENIRADIMRSAILYPDLKIIWSDILPRRYWHYGNNHGTIEGTRKTVNIAVRKVVKEEITAIQILQKRREHYIEMIVLIYPTLGTTFFLTSRQL